MNDPATEPQTPTMPDADLHPRDDPSPWVEPSTSGAVAFRAAVAADLLAHVPPALRPPTFAKSASVVLRSPGFRMALLYRISHAARYRLGLPGRLVAGCLFWAIRHIYGCSIASSARIYGGLILPHPQGIVIGADVVVGPRGWIYQNVTLGGSPGKSGSPRVGSDSRIYAGAVLSGPIRVGDNVVVGANSVITQDIPSRRLVRSPQPEVIDLPPRFLVTGESEAGS